MDDITRLRDLPGIAELEAALHVPGRQLLKQFDDLDARIDAASRRYFGIGEADTHYKFSEQDYLPAYYGKRDGARMVNEQALAREQAWEENFAFLEYVWDEEDAFWTAAGWNVNHDEGEQLLLMEHFGRQLVCVIKQLVPEAQFSPSGEHAPISEELMTRRLEDEARRFVANKLRGGK